MQKKTSSIVFTSKKRVESTLPNKRNVNIRLIQHSSVDNVSLFMHSFLHVTPGLAYAAEKLINALRTLPISPNKITKHSF